MALRPAAATSLTGAVLHANRGVADNVVAVDVSRIVQAAQRCEGGRASHLEVKRRAATLRGANNEQPRQAGGAVAEGPLLRVSGEHEVGQGVGVTLALRYVASKYGKKFGCGG